jgi:hypothetical protein
MRDEHADACKCPRCGAEVIPLKRRRPRTEGVREHLEFQSQQVRLDAIATVFSRINPSC